MNVSRRMANGQINPYEPTNTQIIYATSAGIKSSYAYAALIDMLENAIISPKNYFVFGMDYRIPMMHGLLDKNLIQDIKMNSSYTDASFAAEYQMREVLFKSCELLGLTFVIISNHF